MRDSNLGCSSQSYSLSLIQVDGELYTLPMNTDDGKLWITQEGNNIIVQSSFGFLVFYDTASYVRVSIPSTYKGRMCGLAGNFNGDKNDDFMLPNGKLTQNVDEFGASWKVPTDGVSCSDGCGENCPTCHAAEKARYEVESACGMILSKRGPFRDCHTLVNPLDYFRQCVYDMCVGNRSKEPLCLTLQAYVAACQVAGAKIGAWRAADFCCKFAN